MKFLLSLVAAVSLAGMPALLDAAAASNDTGVRLLKAQLPSGTVVAQISCDQLARAVGRATISHRENAAAILSAALTNGMAKDPQHLEGKRSCACVTHIFRVALAAAPTQAAGLLETASALYPDCADSLTAAMDRADDKNVVDDKNGPARSRAANHDDGSTPVRGFGSTGDPGDQADPGDLSSRDDTGLGFGSGFGPGFPGSPGFVGSPASGGIALPAPVPVTSVVNG